MEISEENKSRIRNDELASVVVDPNYFEEGDYTSWQDNSDETTDMTYDEFQAWLIEDMQKYDSIVVYSDGTIYGNKGGISHDISYDDFNEVETFIELAEKYGTQEIEFS